MVALWHTYTLHRYPLVFASPGARIPPPRRPLEADPASDDLRERLPPSARDQLAHLPASTAFVAWTMACDGHSPAWLARHLDLSPADAATVCKLAAGHH
ncbi:MAG: hypothetical protein HOU81_02595 [Hamadaea sp.]|uniref:hypothetical protein n=1 Tax=Hamadaea sp. TaxID=2024425 RepID=UPI0017F033B8|nr:hypothetical protein [Hamadaea sp.]NUR69685.1 hypothetical protein [Hamadaea sp.]NUT19552.1 hypothetical protein [Hamadaea sp.]